MFSELDVRFNCLRFNLGELEWGQSVEW